LWDSIVNILSDDKGKYAVYNFPPKKKSLQDHFKTLKMNRDAVVAKQIKDSGTVVEDREVDIVLDAIREDMTDCLAAINEQKAQSQEREDAEKAKAIDMRKTAMETIGATKKRKSEENGGGLEASDKKAPRRGGNETFAFLESRREQREDELKFRREEAERQRKDRADQNNLMNVMIQTMQDQQKQQQQYAQQQAEEKRKEQSETNKMMLTMMQNMHQQQQQQAEQSRTQMSLFTEMLKEMNNS
jgi:hypothetical protein